MNMDSNEGTNENEAQRNDKSATRVSTGESSKCCNLLLLIVIILGAEGKLQVLKDDLLVTGYQTIKAVATEYTLVVLIDELQYTSYLRDDVVKLTASLKQPASLGKVSKSDLAGTFKLGR